jgi:hypothetical protein
MLSFGRSQDEVPDIGGAGRFEMEDATPPIGRGWRVWAGWLLAVMLGGLFTWHDFGAPVSLLGMLAVLAAGVSLHLVVSFGKGEGRGKWFPGWAGPLVGVHLGVLIAFAASWRTGQPLTAGWLVACALGGLVIGGIMWLLDLIRAATNTGARDPAPCDRG